MKRDMDLIRLLLLQIEKNQPVDLPPYTSEQINYHQALLIEAGLAKGIKPHNSSQDKEGKIDFVYITGLTGDGHDCLNKIRNETIWGKVKQILVDNGLSFSVETIAQALATVTKGLLG